MGNALMRVAPHENITDPTTPPTTGRFLGGRQTVVLCALCDFTVWAKREAFNRKAHKERPQSSQRNAPSFVNFSRRHGNTIVRPCWRVWRQFLGGLCGEALPALHELQRSRVHTVPKSCRLRSIVEHMPQVRVAQSAVHRIANHSERRVSLASHVLFSDWGPEARPSCPRFELGVGAEQCIVAADAAVDPLLVQIPI